MKSFFEYMEGADPCWKGYKQFGMKKKDGKSVPNCVKEDGVAVGAGVAPTNTTAGIAPSIQDPPVSKKAQKRIRKANV